MNIAMKPDMKRDMQPIISDGSHLVAAYSGDSSGPTLIVVGSIHGNEPAGLKAQLGSTDQLSALEGRMRGRVYLIAGNTRALNRGVRFIDRDLNRSWTPDDLAAMGKDQIPDSSETLELRELDTLLDSILITARSEVFVLDLHSTSAHGIPFATVGDTLRNRRFAQKFPVPIVLGIEEQLEGTMLEYLNNTGAVTIGFEGGSHLAEETVENHISMIWLALINSGILDDKDVPEAASHRDRLGKGNPQPSYIEVRVRKTTTDHPEFKMLEGFTNFDPVIKGQVLAESRNGSIRASESGMILMPLYQTLGEDGYFIGRKVAGFWLKLSEVLRRLKVQDMMPWLPGVKRDPDNYETLLVNTRMARFFPLQILHLLGFRKRRWQGSDLVVSRRRHDTVSPFVKKADR